MANPYIHAKSSARKFGGAPEAYLAVHQWFDETKAAFPDQRHRALRHHSLGIFWCEEKFGPVIKVPLPDGRIKDIPTRVIGEQHVIEDMGFIPTLQDWFATMPLQPFMRKTAVKLERVLDNIEAFERGEEDVTNETKKYLVLGGESEGETKTPI